MKQTIPLVYSHMSPLPQAIQAHQTTEVAKKMMSELGVRHLPVLEGEKVVGVVSDRDLRLLEFWGGVDLNKAAIREAMSPDPYTVSPKTTLSEALREMIRNNYGSALVLEGDKLVGIFTTTDALQVLQERLESERD